MQGKGGGIGDGGGGLCRQNYAAIIFLHFMFLMVDGGRGVFN